MTLQVGVGTSKKRDVTEAAREAVAAAKAKAGLTEKPDFVLVFAAIGYDQNALIGAIREATDRAPLAGCSVEGIITDDGSVEDVFAVEVALIRSNELRFHTTVASNLQEKSEEAGAKVGTDLQPHVGPDALALLVFPDGLTLNFDLIQSGVSRTLKPPKFVPMIGGTAGDNWGFEKTFQYCNDQVYSDSVVAVLLSGSMKMSVAVNHGCVRLGEARMITKARGNVILEIDGKPALDVLGEYLDIEERDDWSKVALNLPFGFEAQDFIRHQDDLVIRYLPSRDVEERSVKMPTMVEAGTRVWMTRRDYPKICKGLETAVSRLQVELAGNTPKLVFNFDCAGRGKVFMRDEEKQRLLQKTRSSLGDPPWIGFHAYGEIAPVGTHNLFHNFTAVLATLH